ncbi:hypothetical protein IKG24_01735 [Candidatus Saccharibacteria bacterium]|nr:hypothetical protein [Candidatus Saccharibacteria bacterium]
MLVKKDSSMVVRKAKIVLQFELKTACNHIIGGVCAPNLNSVAEALYEVDDDLFSPNGDSVALLSITTPVGYRGYNHKIPRWLVVEITEPVCKESEESDWEEALATTAAKMIKKLAPEGDDSIASIEYDDATDRHQKKFVVMTDDGNSDNSYIYI